MSIDLSTGLPDIVSVQKQVFPLLFSSIVSTQPTSMPVATTFGLKKITTTQDASGWTKVDFQLDRWFAPVESNKLKTEVSIEALTDMRAIGVSDTMITDHLADRIADDINQDLLAKLALISTVGAAVVIAAAAKHIQGRELYGEIHAIVAGLEQTTGCTGTYAVAGGDAYGLLLASGWVSKVGGTNYSIAKSGLIIVNDKYSGAHYFTVGVKKKFGDTELSSLVFSPYDVDGSGGLSYLVKAQDPGSFNPIFGIMARYAVTAAPLTEDVTQVGAIEIDWDAITPGQRSALSSSHVLTIT